MDRQYVVYPFSNKKEQKMINAGIWTNLKNMLCERSQT